jgi:hypothetical protein
MNRIIIIVLISLISFSKINAAGDGLWYISPGLTFSYDFTGNILISPKISIGMFSHLNFVNITIGGVSPLKGNQYSYFYFEPQFGGLFLHDD